MGSAFGNRLTGFVSRLDRRVGGWFLVRLFVRITPRTTSGFFARLVRRWFCVRRARGGRCRILPVLPVLSILLALLILLIGGVLLVPVALLILGVL